MNEKSSGESLVGFDNYEEVDTVIDERDVRKKARRAAHHYHLYIPKTPFSFPLPEDYFSGFTNKLYAIQLKDLKASQNDAIIQLHKSKGMFVYPAGVERFQDFVQDTKRNLNIVVEVDETGQPLLKTIYDSNEFFDGEDARKEARGEQFVNALYCMLGLESYHIDFDVFKAVASAYYQKLMYFPKEIIDGAIPLNVEKEPSYFTADFSVMCDLVFARNGQIYLDLYQPICTMVDPSIIGTNGVLRAPCPSQMFIRIPFDKEKSAFGHPLFLCNEHAIPFFMDKVVWKKDLPAGADGKEKEALEASIKKALEENKASTGKIKRPLIGRHGGKVIAGVAVATGAVVATVVFAPGAIPALLLAYFGYSLTTSVAAVTVVAVTGVGTGAASTTYLLARKLNKRGLVFVELDQCRKEKLDDFVMLPIGSSGNHGMYLRATPDEQPTRSEDEVPAQTQSNTDSPRNK